MLPRHVGDGALGAPGIASGLARPAGGTHAHREANRRLYGARPSGLKSPSGVVDNHGPRVENPRMHRDVLAPSFSESSVEPPVDSTRGPGPDRPEAAESAAPSFPWLLEETIRRILLIRYSALGDVIHVLPALTALRERFPEAQLCWLVEPSGASLLEGHPFLDRLLIANRKAWLRGLRNPGRWGRTTTEIGRLLSELRREHFDLVVDFQGNHRSGLSTFLSGGRYRLGFHPSDCREVGGWFFSNLRARPAPLLQPRVLKNLHLLREMGWSGPVPKAVVPVRDEDRQRARRVIASLPGSGPVVTLHPAVSAFGRFKQWSIESYRELCELLRSEIDARVLLTWGPGELELVRAIGRGVPAPPTPRLLALAALLAESHVVIASDTGCLHLAAALGIPVVGIYGPKSPRVYGPYPPRGRIVASDVPCHPCKLRRCEHRICMSSITAREVLGAVLQTVGT